MDKMSEHDSVVWRIDIHELHDLLPEKYREESRRMNNTVFSVDMMQDVCDSLKQYDDDMKLDNILMRMTDSDIVEEFFGQ